MCKSLISCPSQTLTKMRCIEILNAYKQQEKPFY